jgi:hypothetical protein
MTDSVKSFTLIYEDYSAIYSLDFAVVNRLSDIY